MITKSTVPDLEERFLEPVGWRWHSFERAQGRKIRFGSVFPQDSIPDAVIVCLQGLGEFSEKYFELARWCNDNNLAFWTFDWAGQGKSSRYLDNPQKRHAASFDEDITDLHYLIMEYIKHSSVHPDKGRIPLAMIAHSMGGNIGLQYIDKHPDIFECAAFSAPMTGLKIFEKFPQSLSYAVSLIANILAGKSYAFRNSGWDKESTDTKLSSDPIRNLIHNKWFEKNSDLVTGGVTFGWLNQAQKSCLKVQKSSDITIPSIFGIPENENLVDSNMTKKIAARIRSARIIDYPESFHEILMEKDSIRSNYLDNVYQLIKENIIDRPETLKPF